MSSNNNFEETDATLQQIRVADFDHQIDVLSMDLFKILPFKAKFDTSKLNISTFLRWILSASDEALSEICSLVSPKFNDYPNNSNFTSISGDVEE